MPERRVTVASKVGLHARPAALVAKAAAAQSVMAADHSPTTTHLSALVMEPRRLQTSWRCLCRGGGD